MAKKWFVIKHRRKSLYVFEESSYSLEIIFNNVNWHLLLDFNCCLLFRPVSLKVKKSFKEVGGEKSGGFNSPNF